jgi:hypothetical protein
LLTNKIQIISALQNKNLEYFFTDKMVEKGIEILNGAISLESSGANYIHRNAAIVFILPILGDNDLVLSEEIKLKRFLCSHSLLGHRIIIVLKGDRHISDEFVLESSPLSLKLHKIFKNYFSFKIIKTKLENDTAVHISNIIFNLIQEPLRENAFELDQISRILNHTPDWNESSKQISFDDTLNGSNFLCSINKIRLRKLANLIKCLKPKTLISNYAYMSSGYLDAFSNLSTITKLQLNSNVLTLDQVLTIFPQTHWISLGANQIDNFNLNKSGEMLESIFLHKNSIQEVVIDSSLSCKLKQLSFYRNEIKSFEWPIDQNKIERLNFGANPIKALPQTLSEMENLKFIGVAKTRIKKFPDWIFNLPSLQEIDISYIEDQLPINQVNKFREIGISLIKKPI